MLLKVLWMLVVMGMLGGCNIVGWLGQAVAPKTKAIFPLADRPTLILVEDPQNLFKDPTIARLIAQRIGDLLLDHHVITTLVPAYSVDELRMNLGEDFVQVGIDQIGRAVHGEQVVHVHLESLILYPDPGLLEPTASVQVKVIDAVNRKRIFPRANSAFAAAGHRVRVKLLSRGADPGDSETRVAMRKLAARLVRDCARLFYAYMPRQPGEPFE